MNKLISLVAAGLIALGLSACNKDEVMKTTLLTSSSAAGLAASGAMLRYSDKSPAPAPHVHMSPDKWEVLTSYSDVDNSPTLERWWNGRVVVSCPRGHHFVVETIDPINQDQPGATATCEPNPAPGIAKR